MCAALANVDPSPTVRSSSIAVREPTPGIDVKISARGWLASNATSSERSTSRWSITEQLLGDSPDHPSVLLHRQNRD